MSKCNKCGYECTNEIEIRHASDSWYHAHFIETKEFTDGDEKEFIGISVTAVWDKDELRVDGNRGLVLELEDIITGRVNDENNT